MDLRSIKPGLAAVQHPLFMLHPKTGEMVTPLAWSKLGRPAWPVMGGAPDDDDDAGGKDGGKGKKDDDADEDDDEDDSSDDDSDDDEDEDDDDDTSKSKKKGGLKAKVTALEEEKDRHYKKYKKEKSRADDLEARLKALEDKDLKPEEKEQRAKDDQARKDKAAEVATSRLRLENAFLRANDIEWVKPEQALTILLGDDDYEVEFNDDGTVDRKSLRAELKRLAKANPHLVKPKPAAKDDDDDDGSASGANGSKSTAPRMNGKQKGKGGKDPSREELAKKFPALNRA